MPQPNLPEQCPGPTSMRAFTRHLFSHSDLGPIQSVLCAPTLTPELLTVPWLCFTPSCPSLLQQTTAAPGPGRLQLSLLNRKSATLGTEGVACSRAPATSDISVPLASASPVQERLTELGTVLPRLPPLQGPRARPPDPHKGEAV